MNRLIETLILVCLGITLHSQQVIATIEFDGSDQTSLSIASNSCDNTPNNGVFGIENGRFVINDMEGFGCCPCAFGGGNSECGDNSSFASILGFPPLFNYCNVTIEAEVRVRGTGSTMECQSNPGSNPTEFCDFNGLDAMKIVVRLDGFAYEIGSYCGNERNGTFSIDNLTPDPSQGILAIEITGGTQDPDEAYEIERIVVSGTPISIVPPDIIQQNLNIPCAGTDPLVLNVIGGSASATYSWALDGNTLPETGLLLTRAPATLADAGTYSVTLIDPANPCNDAVITEVVQINDCTDPAAEFNGLQDAFCRDFDQLNLPLTSDNGFNGTWNVPSDLVLNTVAPFTELIFTPDPVSGATEFRLPITLESVPIFGEFTDKEICVYDEPGQAVNLISQFNLRTNDIITVDGFGMSFFDPPNDVVNISLNNIDAGVYPIFFETIPYGRCGQQDTVANLTIHKIDRVGNQTLIHCSQDANTVDFNNLIGVDRVGGTWADLDGTGIDLNLNPSATDLSGLAPGSFQFSYEGVGANVAACSGLEGSAIVTVNVVRGASDNVGTFDPGVPLCQGAGQTFLIEGILFSETNTTQNVLLPGQAANSCDSLLIVDLVYNPTAATDVRESDRCEGDGFFVEVNGTRYDETNRFGTETLFTSTGCDSVVTVDLIFNPSPTRTVSPQGLCQGDPFCVIYNSTVYNESNPSGVEIVPSTGLGCDSVITIDLIFEAAATGTETYSGCVGDGYEVNINGTAYNEANPSGTETIIGGAANGCDSIVTINLTFDALIPKTFSPANLCSGSTFSANFNGNTYDESNPSGQEVIQSTTTGCDTLLTIDLIFNSIASGTESYDGCSGDGYSVIVNGIIFDETNSTGTETLLGAASNGCDSIVSINLQYKTVTPGQETYLGNEGDGYSVVVNGNTYNEQNPNGVDTLVGAALNGCDSIVTTTLTFVVGLVGEEMYTGCIGDGYEVTVGTSTYNESNPSGIDSLVTSSGIDSIVSTMLVFNDPRINQVDETHTLGGGYSVSLNGITYDESNPTGNDTIPNAAQNGCDSIIMVNLNFASAIISSFDSTLCLGDPFTSQGNGSVYNEANPSGIDTFLTNSGIDSIVTTSLTFVGASEENIDDSRCEGDGFQVVGWNRTFDEQNPSGRDTLVGGDKNGCDSIIIVSLVFNSNVLIQNDIDLCPGETEIVGNSVYSENNLMGSDTLFTGTGCDTIIMTTVNLDSIIVDISEMESCANMDNGSLVLTNLVNNSTLIVTVDGQSYTLTNMLVIPELAGGSYNIDISNANGCMISESTTIDMLPLSNLSIDTAGIGMDSFMLDFIFDGIVDEFMWSADTGTVCSTCTSINIGTTSDNVYTIMVTDEFGCTYTASLSVGAPPVVVTPSEPREFFVSNAISSNGMNGNQTLYLQTSELDIESYDLAVYGRWGSKLYDARGLFPNDPSRGWNAEMAGDEVEIGVYIYRIELYYTDGSSEVVAGDVLFLK